MAHKGTKIKFWTDPEIKACKTCIEKFDNLSAAATFLAPKLERTYAAVYFKMQQLKNGYKKPTHKAKIVNKGIELPKGFIFDFECKRVVLNHNGSVTIYFK
jgi:hypothetical protein